MKTVFSKKPNPDPELLALKAELLDAQNQLALAYHQFNQAVDPELVESCVYQINADKARCNYLIRAIKQRSPDTAAASGRVPTEAQRSGFSERRISSEMSEFSPVGGNERYEAREDGGDAVWT